MNRLTDLSSLFAVSDGGDLTRQEQHRLEQVEAEVVRLCLVLVLRSAAPRRERDPAERDEMDRDGGDRFERGRVEHVKLVRLEALETFREREKRKSEISSSPFSIVRERERVAHISGTLLPKSQTDTVPCRILWTDRRHRRRRKRTLTGPTVLRARGRVPLGLTRRTPDKRLVETWSLPSEHGGTTRALSKDSKGRPESFPEQGGRLVNFHSQDVRVCQKTDREM